jgi:inward rectifier potassium channel
MSKLRRFQSFRRQASQEVGFGITPVNNQRLMNADGTYNYVRVGLPWYESFNIFHFLMTVSLSHFILIVFAWYSVINFFFTALYYWIGAENLTGMIFKTEWERFTEVYFFSAQTLTTVGYGRINPMGLAASSLASIEALIGLLSFAVFTGLVYARFAKPKASFMFSEKALISPFNDITGLMFRFANKTTSNLMNMKIHVTLSILEVDDNGIENRKFYTPLSLERDSLIFFPSSWTIVHPIDDTSPLYGMNEEDFVKAQPELMILISGFDDTFDADIHDRHAYDVSDMEWGAKFVKIFGTMEDGRPQVDLSKLNVFDKMPI